MKKKIPNKYLPIGTVVMLKGGTKRVMIAGFCTIQNQKEDENEIKIWDYCGCLYPEGLLSSSETCLFDHEQIQEIFHLGLSAEEDEEEKSFKENLKSFIENIDNTDKKD